ncbi:MAG: ATP-dependent DNA ligase [Candidatus Dormibacteraeota bacterium]|nr:ATP-dependent DNA ligase [Candidatus Dormibacteraeota bacterium]MDQ6920747.1 ATP-dependent DNA ligase [Candidatus Dormibacteraeota bacterium]
MKFSELAGYLDQLAATNSRNELVRILSELYRACSVDEIEPITYLIQGRLAPFFEPVEMGLGERLLLSAIALAYGRPKDEVSKLYRQVGDLGVTVEQLAPQGVNEPPSVSEVHRRLFEIAGTSGAGSLQRKLDLFAGLLGELDQASAKHLVRITVGKLRLGIGDPTVLDALSFAQRGDRSLRPVLEAAYNRTSDLGLIARTLWSEGVEGLDALKVTVGKPLRCQLAERLPNPEAVIRKLGVVGVQPKYDGFRVQIHRDGEQVSIFSRNLETMTSMFPELVAAAGRLKVESVILDAEAIAYNPESEEYVPFQETTARRRKEGIEEFAVKVPLRAFVFDAMYRDGSDLTPLPYEKRLQIVDEVLEGSDALLPAPLTVTDSVDVLTKELLDNISRGLEGVVAKRLDSPYQAGARNFNWVKLKRNTSGELTDTVDVVLLGYYGGKGKRAEFGAGALLAGVYDTDRDEFVTISKLGTGLSDEGWRELHKQVSRLEVSEKPARVNSILVPDQWLQPEIVVEVLADEITPSPRHTAGMVGDQPGFALRFPRIVSFRSADKNPEDATTVREIREMSQQQHQRR